MTYPEAIKYLESFINYEKIPQWPYKESLKLERIKGFLKAIGDPQVSLKCLHIAGTKGKGSTCAFLTYILRAAGYRVGLYTSPHLSDFRERIRILQAAGSRQQAAGDFEGMITKNDFVELVDRLKPSIEEYNKNSKYEPLSFFEVYTTLAFVYFKEKKVDFAVLETGLGGRLDATNVVKPLVCAITSLSYEHTQKLGNTLREIATEKAGIIKVSQFPPEADQPLAKASSPVRQLNRQTGHLPAGRQEPANRQTLVVISAPQEKEAIEVIRNRCKKVGARLYEVNRDIFYEKTATGFNIMGMFGEYPNLEIRLLGEHQFVNASVAIGVVEALRFYGIIVGADSVRGGLYNTVWPGRCEVISKKPLLVLDGAQNVASAKALKETIKENFSAKGGSARGGKYKRLILVLGISSDKDIPGICNQLKTIADAVILTKANNPRATKPEVLAGYFNGKDTHITTNVTEAKSFASRIAQEEDLILVTGSLFVVGEFRHLAGPVPAFGGATR